LINPRAYYVPGFFVEKLLYYFGFESAEK
jgi:hypothetical protein